MNGMYEEYQELYESIGTLKQPQSKITIILKLSGNSSNGKRVGEWKEFFANGKLKSKINYSTGESETYSEYGDLLNKTFKKIQ
jgi:antitoxin component YwqK of YwqJK toxin-antitoxin module